MKEILITFSILVSFLMIYLTILNFKKKLLNNFEILSWTAVWFSIIILSIRPKMLDNFIVEKFNVSIFYIFAILGFIFFTIIIFYLYNKIKILESKQDSLIRSASLSKIFKKIKD